MITVNNNTTNNSVRLDSVSSFPTVLKIIKACQFCDSVRDGDIIILTNNNYNFYGVNLTQNKSLDFVKSSGVGESLGTPIDIEVNHV